jgi:hypothetical protein
MHPTRRRSFPLACRWILLPWWGCLFLGCVLIPVEESRFGSPQLLRFSAEHAPYATGDIVFSHDLHSFEPCDTCHFGTTAEETYPGRARSERGEAPREHPGLQLPAMARCFSCHDGKPLSNDCITCHLTNRQDRKPAFHDALFPRNHKRMADEEAYKCSLCHLEGECQGCPAERKPFSHTPRFEKSAHGRLATHDRRSCATCHETAFCENCHSLPPSDHTQIFTRGGGHKQAALLRGRSCLVCHRFGDRNSCAECHG